MPHYEIPPIVEAIIDLRVPALPTAPELPSISGIKHSYSDRKELFEATSEISFTDKEATSVVQKKQVGYRYDSDDKKFVIQSRLTGFTCSRLAVYDEWQSFEGEARRVWSMYRTAAAPETITRLAVRTINRIDIPRSESGGVDFTKYLVARVELPVRFSLTHGFLMQTKVALEDIGGELVLTEALAPPTKEGFISVLLDTDISIARNVPSDEEQIWELFGRLHDYRNDVFEECLTAKAKELFKPIKEV